MKKQKNNKQIKKTNLQRDKRSVFSRKPKVESPSPGAYQRQPKHKKRRFLRLKMNNSTTNLQIGQSECFSAVPSTVFTVALSLITITAVAGNFLLIAAFFRTSNLKTSSNWYIINMAISDVVSVLLNWPLYVTEGMLKPGGSLITNQAIATFFCKLGIYSRAVLYVVSIESLVLISVDRFIAIVFPLKAIKITARVRKILLLLSWLLPVLGATPYFYHSKILLEGRQTFCRNFMSTLLFKVYQFASFILFYFAPLVVLLVVHYIGFKHLKKRLVFEISSNEGSTHTLRSKENQNILKIFRAVTLGFFMCWTPLYIYLILKSSHPTIVLNDKCLLFIGLLYYVFPLISTAINPFILITLSSNYRAAVKDVLAKCFAVFKCRSNKIYSTEQVIDLR